MSNIAIIGAGLSGRLLALNLLKSAAPDSTADIQMFDRGDQNYMGPAYSNDAEYLLLNVPAVRMGAFSNDPEHFLKWAQNKGISAGKWDFLPRKLYREYLLNLLNEARVNQNNNFALSHITGEVNDLELKGNYVTIHTENKGSFIADKAVLAFGNFPPRNPNIKNRSAFESKHYIQNPWTPGVLESLTGNETVLIIGTGQTTVDLLITLYRRFHKGRIIAISRRGFMPLAHSSFETYESFYNEIKYFRSVKEIFRTVRKHFELAESMGIDKRAVIDSLRPDTQLIWMNLPEEEKRRFLRHLFRYWEIIRSRIPHENDLIVKDLLASGQLRIIRGRINDILETNGVMEVQFINCELFRPEIEKGELVINCAGPESNYQKINHPLIRNLLKRGLVRPGPAEIGIDAFQSGAVIGKNGEASELLYTLGSTMRGVLWEVLAVPEIRVQAENLARVLLKSIPERI